MCSIALSALMVLVTSTGSGCVTKEISASTLETTAKYADIIKDFEIMESKYII